MAEWNKGKVLPSAINGGQEFTKKDNLAVNELNAIVNNSFYASEKSERAESLAESAVKGNGTLVTIGGQIQGEWSADFVEAERQKSKNLITQPYIDGNKETFGITYVVNNDGSIIANGTATWNATFDLCNKNFKAGSYFATIKDATTGEIISSDFELQLIHNGQYFIVANKTFTLETETTCYFQLYVLNGATVNRSVIVEVSREGAIVHEKDIADVEHIETIYDTNNSDMDWGYDGGIIGGVEVTGKDFSKYKKLRVYAYVYNTIINYDIQLNRVVREQVAGYTHYGAGETPSYTNIGNYYASQSIVNTAKTSFYHYNVGFREMGSSAFTNKNGDTNYYVYKIEGVY